MSDKLTQAAAAAAIAAVSALNLMGSPEAKAVADGINTPAEAVQMNNQAQQHVSDSTRQSNTDQAKGEQRP